jgi:Glycosyl hydrolase family 20, domain 2
MARLDRTLWNRFSAIFSLVCVLLNSNRSLAKAEVPVFPTPQSSQSLEGEMTLLKGPVEVVFILPIKVEPAVRAAAELILHGLKEAGLDAKVVEREAGQPLSKNGFNVILLPFSELPTSLQRGMLSSDDRRFLTRKSSTGQEYVLITKPQERAAYLVGQSGQGVLYAAASLLQLMARAGDGLRIPAIHIRDFPDFKYRMAADWLSNVEINRWVYDWGDGVEGYAASIKRKLDLCARYKINMVLAHGFGWGTEFFPGFAAMMKGLNGYARARGIKMVTGGYGASYGIAYQSGPLYEEAPYLGKVFKNQDSYPSGKVYQCMGFSYSKDPSIDTRTLGSCRANDALNALKADELREYVTKTEPGGLYVHHEDFGGFQGSQQSWLQRCDRCRKRWPSDDLKAPNGGAGGLACGYRALIEAVQSVKNSQTGYDAARDCTVILVSPVYDANPESKTDWENVLNLWRNIGRALPKSPNVQICFREVFPLKSSARRWIPDFNQAMAKERLPFKAFMFFAGGADNYQSDYPVVASPSLNRSFLGAETIYNGGGGIDQEPFQLINAEYSWNSRSNGFFADPGAYEEAVDLWHKYRANESRPGPLFDAGGMLDRVCALLYGRGAGKHIAELNRLFVSAGEQQTPPGMWTKLYPLSVLWRSLAVDSAAWTKEISDPKLRRFLSEKGMDSAGYHRNMASRWAQWKAVSDKGLQHVQGALGEGDLKPESRDDLEYLSRCLNVGARFSDLIADLHAWLASSDGQDALLRSARGKASELEIFIQRSFKTGVIDPSGGDIRAWLASLKKIRLILSAS